MKSLNFRAIAWRWYEWVQKFLHFFAFFLFSWILSSVFSARCGVFVFVFLFFLRKEKKEFTLFPQRNEKCVLSQWPIVTAKIKSKEKEPTDWRFLQWANGAFYSSFASPCNCWTKKQKQKKKFFIFNLAVSFLPAFYSHMHKFKC